MTGSKSLNELLPLTPTVFHVLVALASGPRHGYAVAQEVEELHHHIMSHLMLMAIMPQLLQPRLV